jgi:hypothetical protein
MNPLITRCPVCGGDLSVTRLHCPRCDTTIEGEFTPGKNAGGPFGQLSPEQMQFLLTFIRCEGKFNRMEEELKLSYPTLRNRFNEILRVMGYEPGREEPPVRPPAEERRRILEDLDQGRITWAEAQRRLKGKKDETAASPSGAA